MPKLHSKTAVLNQLKLDIDVITPMFGGGAHTATVEEDLPVRGGSVRGHLRFWWRATRGKRCETVAELKKLENVIWGTTTAPSAVKVYLKMVDRGSPYRYPDRKDSLSYALFPFEKNPRESDKPGSGLRGVHFQIFLSYPPEMSNDVEAAVWAWVNFGGVGARTRRGLGSMRVDPKKMVLDSANKGHREGGSPSDDSELDVLKHREKLQDALSPAVKDSAAVQAWYERVAGSFNVPLDGVIREWPTIPVRVFANIKQSAPLEAWKRGVECLKKFRQEPEFARRKKNGKAARSKWPEPDSLRVLTGRHADEHKDPVTNVTQGMWGFPRAELGLPIIFKFKGDRDTGEPWLSQLYPAVGNRMASPLVIKALALENGQAIPIILHLVTPAVETAILKSDKNKWVVGVADRRERDLPVGGPNIRNPEFAKYKESPLAKSREGSALEAFIEFAKDGGYR